MNKTHNSIETKIEAVEMSDNREETSVKETKKLSKEDKKNLRRNAVNNAGRLYLDESMKEDGYVYRVCNLTPGNLEKYKLHGAEVVTHKLSSGNGSLGTPEVNGTPTEFEVGGTSSGSMKAIWIRMQQEDYDIMKELEREEAKAQEEMIKGGVDPLTGKAMIPKENLIGTIKKG